MNVDPTRTPRHTSTARRFARSAGAVPARVLAVLAILAAISVATLSVGTGVAGAHGDEGEVTVTRAEQSGPNRIDLEVGIVYGDDGHIAADAAVTATLVGPSGDTVGPVPLDRVDPNSSLFAGEVEVSGVGSWAVAIATTNPDGAADAAVEVVEMPADEPDDTTASTEPPATTEVELDGTASAADTPLDAALEDTTGSDNRWLLVGAAVAAVALAAIVTFALRRNGDVEPDDDTLA